MDEAVKPIEMIVGDKIMSQVKKKRGRPKEYVKCKNCKAWMRIGKEHKCPEVQKI